MYDQTNKLWFKIISFIVLETFLFTIADISWAANYRENRGSQEALMDQRTKDSRDKLSADALSDKLVLTQPAMPYMGFEQVITKGQIEAMPIIDTTISGLSIAGNDLPTIFKTLKTSGCTVAEAGFGAVRQGFNKKEIYHALIKAGYDKDEVNTLLGGLLKAEEDAKVQETDSEESKTGPPLLKDKKAQKEEEEALKAKEGIFEIPKVTDMPVEKEPAKIIESTTKESAILRQTVEFVRIMINEGKRGAELIRILKKAGLTDERIINALAQMGFNLKDIITIFKEANISCTEIVQSIHKAQVNYSDKEIYEALLKAGFTDKDIVSAFKAAGISAGDILKIAADLSRSMTDIAQAMVDAGFRFADIARAYVLKAMKGVWDNSINLVNCAVRAFDAFLTNIGRKFASKEDLAYELIVDDILATGEVEIKGKDVMTSMMAIKNVAQKYGIGLEGFKLSIESLKELNQNAIILLDSDHWVTIVSIDGDQVTIIDNGQEQVISLTELKIRWDGTTLALNQNGQGLKYNQLLDLQMRQIRGGRSGIGGFFSSIWKGIKNVFSAIWKCIKKVLLSKIFNWILTIIAIVCAFLPILWWVTALIIAALSALRTYAAGGSFGDCLKTFVISFAVAVVAHYGAEALMGAMNGAGTAAPGAAEAGAEGFVPIVEAGKSGLSGAALGTTAVAQASTVTTTQLITTQLTQAAVSQVVGLAVQYVGQALGLDKTAWGRVFLAVVSAVASAYASYQVGSYMNETWANYNAKQAESKNSANNEYQSNNSEPNESGYQAPNNNTQSPNVIPNSAPVVPYSTPILNSANQTIGYNFNMQAAVVTAITNFSQQVVYEIAVHNKWDPFVTSALTTIVGGLTSSLAGAAIATDQAKVWNEATQKYDKATTFGEAFSYYAKTALPSMVGTLVEGAVSHVSQINGWNPQITSSLSTALSSFGSGMTSWMVGDAAGGYSKNTSFFEIASSAIVKGAMDYGISEVAVAMDMDAVDLHIMFAVMDASQKSADAKGSASDIVAAGLTKFASIYIKAGSFGVGTDAGTSYNNASAAFKLTQFADHIIHRNEWKERDNLQARMEKAGYEMGRSGEKKNISFWDAYSEAISSEVSTAAKAETSARADQFVSNLFKPSRINQSLDYANEQGWTTDNGNGTVTVNVQYRANLVAYFQAQQLWNSATMSFDNLLQSKTISDVQMTKGDFKSMLSGEGFNATYRDSKVLKAGTKEIANNAYTYLNTGNGTSVTIRMEDVEFNNSNLKPFALQAHSKVTTTSVAYLQGTNQLVSTVKVADGIGNVKSWNVYDATTNNWITGTNTPGIWVNYSADGKAATIHQLNGDGSIGKTIGQIRNIFETKKIVNGEMVVTNRVGTGTVSTGETINLPGNSLLSNSSAAFWEVSFNLFSGAIQTTNYELLGSNSMLNKNASLGVAANGNIEILQGTIESRGGVDKFGTGLTVNDTITTKGVEAKADSDAADDVVQQVTISPSTGKAILTIENGQIVAQGDVNDKTGVLVFNISRVEGYSKSTVNFQEGQVFDVRLTEGANPININGVDVYKGEVKAQNNSVTPYSGAEIGIYAFDRQGNQTRQRVVVSEDNKNRITINLSNKAPDIVKVSLAGEVWSLNKESNTLKTTFSPERIASAAINVNGLDINLNIKNDLQVTLYDGGLFGLVENFKLESGITLEADTTRFAVTQNVNNKLELRFSQIGLDVKAGSTFTVGGSQLLANIGQGSPSEETVTGKNTVQLHYNSAEKIWELQGGKLLLHTAGVQFNNGDVVKISGLDLNALAGFKANAELYTGSFVSVGNIKITTDGSYKITQNSVMSADANSRILLTLTTGSGQQVDTIMNLQKISLPEGSKSVDYYAPHFQNFSKECVGMSFKAQGIDFTIKDNGANKFWARSDVLAYKAEIKLNSYNQTSQLNLEGKTELTINVQGSIVTAKSLSFGTSSTLEAGAEVKVLKDKNVEIVSGQLHLAKKDAFQGARSVETIQPAKTLSTLQDKKDTKVEVDIPEAHIELLGNGKYNLHGDLSFNQKQGVYLSDGTKVDISSIKGVNDFVSIGNSNAVKGTFVVDQGQLKAIEAGSQLLEHSTASGEYITWEYLGTEVKEGKTVDLGWTINASDEAIKNKTSWSGTFAGQEVSYNLAVKNGKTIIQINKGAGLKLEDRILTTNTEIAHKNEVDVTVTQKLANGQFVYTTTDKAAIGLEQIVGSGAGGASMQMEGKTIASITDSVDSEGNKIRTYSETSTKQFEITFTADEKLGNMNVVEQLDGSYLQVTNAEIAGQYIKSGGISFSWDTATKQIKTQLDNNTLLHKGGVNGVGGVDVLYNSEKTSTGIKETYTFQNVSAGDKVKYDNRDCTVVKSLTTGELYLEVAEGSRNFGTKTDFKAGETTVKSADIKINQIFANGTASFTATNIKLEGAQTIAQLKGTPGKDPSIEIKGATIAHVTETKDSLIFSALTDSKAGYKAGDFQVTFVTDIGMTQKGNIAYSTAGSYLQVTNAEIAGQYIKSGGISFSWDTATKQIKTQLDNNTLLHKGGVNGVGGVDVLYNSEKTSTGIKETYTFQNVSAGDKVKYDNRDCTVVKSLTTGELYLEVAEGSRNFGTKTDFKAGETTVKSADIKINQIFANGTASFTATNIKLEGAQTIAQLKGTPGKDPSIEIKGATIAHVTETKDSLIFSALTDSKAGYKAGDFQVTFVTDIGMTQKGNIAYSTAGSYLQVTNAEIAGQYIKSGGISFSWDTATKQIKTQLDNNTLLHKGGVNGVGGVDVLYNSEKTSTGIKETYTFQNVSAEDKVKYDNRDCTVVKSLTTGELYLEVAEGSRNFGTKTDFKAGETTVKSADIKINQIFANGTASFTATNIKLEGAQTIAQLKGTPGKDPSIEIKGATIAHVTETKDSLIFSALTDSKAGYKAGDFQVTFVTDIGMTQKGNIAYSTAGSYLQVTNAEIAGQYIKSGGISFSWDTATKQIKTQLDNNTLLHKGGVNGVGGVDVLYTEKNQAQAVFTSEQQEAFLSLIQKSRQADSDKGMPFKYDETSKTLTGDLDLGNGLKLKNARIQFSDDMTKIKSAQGDVYIKSGLATDINGQSLKVESISGTKDGYIGKLRADGSGAVYVDVDKNAKIRVVSGKNDWTILGKYTSSDGKEKLGAVFAITDKGLILKQGVYEANKGYEPGSKETAGTPTTTAQVQKPESTKITNIIISGDAINGYTYTGIVEVRDYKALIFNVKGARLTAGEGGLKVGELTYKSGAYFVGDANGQLQLNMKDGDKVQAYYVYKNAVSYDAKSVQLTREFTFKADEVNGKIVISQTSVLSLDGHKINIGERFNVTTKENGKETTRQYVVEKIGNNIMPVYKETRLARDYAGETFNIKGENYKIVSDWNADSKVSFVYDIDNSLVSIEGDIVRRDEKGNKHTGVLLHKEAVKMFRSDGTAVVVKPAQEFLLINGNSISKNSNTRELVINDAKILTQTEFYSNQKMTQIAAGTGEKGGKGITENIIKAYTGSDGNVVVKEKQLLTIKNNQWVLTNGDVLMNVSNNNPLLVLSSDGNTIFKIDPGVKGSVSKGGIELTAGIVAVNANAKIIKLDGSGNISGIIVAGKDLSWAKGNYLIANIDENGTPTIIDQSGKSVDWHRARAYDKKASMSELVIHYKGKEINFNSNDANQTLSGIARALSGATISADKSTWLDRRSSDLKMFWYDHSDKIIVVGTAVAVVATVVFAPVIIGVGASVLGAIGTGITSLVAALGSAGALTAAISAFSLGTKIYLTSALATSALSLAAGFFGYMSWGDDIAKARANGEEAGFLKVALFEGASVIRTLAGMLFVGGDVHGASFLHDGIAGSKVTWGHVVAGAGIAVSLLGLGALKIAKYGATPFITMLKSGISELPGAIGRQALSLTGRTIASNIETRKIILPFSEKVLQPAWTALGRSFGYMKTLNAGLWFSGQLAVNYLPESNPAAQIYKYILSPFIGRPEFTLDIFMKDVVIGDWSSNATLGVFALGMFLLAPVVASLSTTRASVLGDVGEVKLGSSFLGRSSSRLINGIVEEGVKERVAGQLLQLAGCPKWAQEFLVEFFFPGGPTAMRTNAATTTKSISEYQGRSEIDVLSKAGVNNINDLENITGQTAKALVDQVQAHYSEHLQPADLNTINGSTGLNELQTMLGFSNEQMSGLISQLSSGGVTLGQISLHQTQQNKNVSLSSLAAALNTEYINPPVTADFTLPVLAMVSGRSIESVLETIGFSSEHISQLKLSHELKTTTLSDIAVILGKGKETATSMNTLAAKLDLSFAQSNTTLTSSMSEIAEFSGKTEEQVQTILRDHFSLTSEKIIQAQKISNAKTFSTISLGAISQVLNTTPQLVVQSLNIGYNAPGISNMINLLQLSRISGMSVVFLIGKLDIGNISLETIVSKDKLDNIIGSINKIEGLENVEKTTTIDQMFSQLDTKFNQTLYSGTKTLQGAQVDLVNTLDLKLETIAQFQGKTTEELAESLNLKHSDAHDIVVTVYQNGVFKFDQKDGAISAQVTGDQHSSVFSAANTQKGVFKPKNLMSIFSAIKNANQFRKANITVQYENGVNLTQFSGVDKLEAVTDELGHIVITGYLNGDKVHSIGLTSKDTISKETGLSSIVQLKAEYANMADAHERSENISSLLSPNMVPKGLDVNRDLRWDIDPTERGGNKIVAQDASKHEVVRFADKLTKIIHSFEAVKSRQNMDPLVNKINGIIKTQENNGIIIASIDSKALFGVLKGASWVNNDMVLTQDLADTIAINLESQLSTKQVKQVDAQMVYAATGRENELKLTELTDMQRDKFLQFISNPTMGHEIGTGTGKTSYLIHLNALAGLIHGKNKAVIILSDKGKLNEAYDGNAKELYDSLLGTGSHMSIDSTESHTQEMLNKARSPKTKVVFTQTSVFGFLTDSKRTVGSVENKLFDTLTNNVQLVQDEIHTIYGQNFIRGRGEDTHLTEDQKKATVVVGDFIKQRAAELERLGAVINQKTGYADLRLLTLSTNSRGYDIAPVFKNAFYVQLADYLNQEKYLGRSDWTQAMLNGTDYNTSEELIHVRSVTKALARFTNEAEGVTWGVFNFSDEKQLRDEKYGLSDDFINKSLKDNRGLQVVPVSFGKLDITRQFSNPYDAAVKHYFGLAAHAYEKNQSKLEGQEDITAEGIKPNLDTVTTTPESTQANYLEFLSIALTNGSDISSMTGTYNLIAGMVNALGIKVDRSERDELVLKYVDVSKDDLRNTIAGYLGITESDLFIKKAGLIAKNTAIKRTEVDGKLVLAEKGNEKFFEMVDKILFSLNITSNEMKDTLATAIFDLQQAKSNPAVMNDVMDKLLTKVKGEKAGATLQALVVAMAEASPFAKAQLESVEGVANIQEAFSSSILSQAVDNSAHQNYIIIPEAEGLSQPNIKRALKEHLSKMADKENFQFVSHDSSDTWTLYRWDSQQNDFIEFNGNLSDGIEIKNGVLSLEDNVSRMLLNTDTAMQTVLLCNVGDVFGLDLKADERTKFIDVMDEGTMLTNAMQGFGRMRGFGEQNAKEFNKRLVYMVGEKTGSLDLVDVFQKLITTENKEVQKITLNVIDDAIRHAGISLLKKMQDQAAGAPAVGQNKILGHAAFAVGESIFKYGGVILSTYLKAVKEHYDLNKDGGKTEYEVIEDKLLELWNKLGQDQDNSGSTPEETQAYLENRLAEGQKFFEALSQEKEFTDRLSENNKKLLNNFVEKGQQIFNKNYETEVTFLDENADITQSEMTRERNLFSLDNTYQSIRTLISQKIKRSDLPARAVFGQSKSSETSTTLAQVQQNVFTGSDAAPQADFLKKHELLRSDNTLTKTGKSYVDNLYKKLDNLSPKEQNMILSAIPGMAIPPEEKKQTGDIATALIDMGYVDLSQLNENTVDKLMNFAYASDLFGASMSEDARLGLQKPENVKQFTGQPTVTLKRYLMVNLPENMKTNLASLDHQILLEDEINNLYKALYFDTPKSAKELKSLSEQLKQKRTQLEAMQNSLPVTMETINNLVSIFDPEKEKDAANYQMVRIFVEPNLSVDKFKAVEKIEAVISSIDKDVVKKIAVSSLVNSYSMDEKQRNLISIALVGTENQQDFDADIKTLHEQVTLGYLDLTKSTNIELVEKIFDVLPKVSANDKLNIINWLAGTNLTETGYNLAKENKKTTNEDPDSSKITPSIEKVDINFAEKIIDNTEFNNLLNDSSVLKIQNGELGVEQLIEKGLAPEYKITLNGSAYFLSSPYEAEGLQGRPAFTLYYYREKDGKKELYLRTVYKSNSHNVWKVVSHWSVGGWIGKGISQESVSLPFEIQSSLENILAEKISLTQGKPGQKLPVLDRDVFYGVVDMGHPVVNTKFANDDFKETIIKEGVRLADKKEIAFFDNPSDPASLRFIEEGYKPDFENGVIENWKSYNPVYDGNVTCYRILSKNKEVQYVFNVNKDKTRVWIGEVQAAKGALTRYGVKADQVRISHDLAVQSFEYESEIPGGFIGKVNENYRGYFDASAWVENLPVIKEFREKVIGTGTSPSVANEGFGDEKQANINIANGMLKKAVDQKLIISRDEYERQLALVGTDKAKDFNVAPDRDDINGAKVFVIDADYLSSVEQGEQHVSAGLRRGAEEGEVYVYITKEKYEQLLSDNAEKIVTAIANAIESGAVTAQDIADKIYESGVVTYKEDASVAVNAVVEALIKAPGAIKDQLADLETKTLAIQAVTSAAVKISENKDELVKVVKHEQAEVTYLRNKAEKLGISPEEMSERLKTPDSVEAKNLIAAAHQFAQNIPVLEETGLRGVAQLISGAKVPVAVIDIGKDGFDIADILTQETTIASDKTPQDRKKQQTAQQIAELVNSGEYKMVVIPGDSGDINADELQRAYELLDIEDTAEGQVTVIAHAAGTKIAADSMRYVDSDKKSEVKYLLLSPRMEADKLAAIMKDAQVAPEQVMTVSREGDFPSLLGSSDVVDTYGSGNNSWMHVQIREKEIDGKKISEIKGHSGMMIGLLEQYNDYVRINGTKNENIFSVAGIYRDFIHGEFESIAGENLGVTSEMVVEILAALPKEVRDAMVPTEVYKAMMQSRKPSAQSQAIFENLGSIQPAPIAGMESTIKPAAALTNL